MIIYKSPLAENPECLKEKAFVMQWGMLRVCRWGISSVCCIELRVSKLTIHIKEQLQCVCVCVCVCVCASMLIY